MRAPTRAGRTWCATSVVTAGLAVSASGCGSDGSGYKNESRPPDPIVVSASIGRGKLAVSPRRFGAGPITLIVTNQTLRAQEITLETDELGGAPGLRQTTGPINPGDTAQLKADLRSGTYKVAIGGKGSSGARLDVGAARASAQNELLQP